LETRERGFLLANSIKITLLFYIILRTQTLLPQSEDHHEVRRLSEDLENRCANKHEGVRIPPAPFSVISCLKLFHLFLSVKFTFHSNIPFNKKPFNLIE
jgi:hypothetical protein